MINEIWRDIKEYEGLYQVSNLGRVKRIPGFQCKKERFLSPSERNGYLCVCLSKNSQTKKFYIHRLVMENFYPIENQKELQVNHKDEIKTNNNLDNLEWVTHKENQNYGTKNKRCAEKLGKKIKCIETGIIYQSAREIERLLGIGHCQVLRVAQGKGKIAGGYHWEYYGGDINGSEGVH